MLKNSDEKNPAWWVEPMGIAYRLSGWLIFPILMGIFVGKWLDKKMSAEPWGFLGMMGFSFIITMTGLIYQSSKEFAKFSQKNDKKVEPDKSVKD
ncbi:MAG: AtpZ/AtpI family protein [Patescibacteria group bacterium]|nr:AtpZ/AtpI family protein [Patescibacteria group bacterium]